MIDLPTITVKARDVQRALELYERHACNRLALAIIADQQVSDAPMTAASNGPRTTGAGSGHCPYDSNIYICRIDPLRIQMPDRIIETDYLKIRVDCNRLQTSKWQAFSNFRGNRFQPGYQWKGGTQVIFQYHASSESFQLAPGISGDLRAAMLAALAPHRGKFEQVLQIAGANGERTAS